MSIVLFWIEPGDGEGGDATPICEFFADDALAAALKAAEARRREGRRHVCISSEHAGSVGAPGVAAVEGGRTPDGHKYEWSKAHRAGRVRR